MKIELGKLATVVLAGVALTQVACGSAPRTLYYTIEPRPASSASSNSVAGRLGVVKPQASHLLRQDRIVYFTKQNELNYYHYHRWAEPPPALLQSLVISRLRAAGLFDDVIAYRAQPELDYILRGQLLAMEEVDTGSEVKARFGLALELVRQDDSHSVWTGQRHCERAVSEHTVEAVVTTINACVDETLTELTRSLGLSLAQLQQSTRAEGESQP